MGPRRRAYNPHSSTLTNLLTSSYIAEESKATPTATETGLASEKG